MRRCDDRVFCDDSVELFLHTAPATKAVYHMMLNCDNVPLDAYKVPDAPPEESPGRKWNPAWQHATSKRAGGWSAEFAIPFEAFGVEAPRQGFVWRVKVGHNAPGTT